MDPQKVYFRFMEDFPQLKKLLFIHLVQHFQSQCNIQVMQRLNLICHCQPNYKSWNIVSLLINIYSLCCRSFWRGRFLDRSVRDVTEETATTDLHRIRTPPRGNLCLMIIVIILMIMIMRALRPTKTWTRNYHGRIKSLSQESTPESRHKVKTEISKQPQSEEIPNTKARNLVHKTKSWTLLRYLGRRMPSQASTT